MVFWLIIFWSFFASTPIHSQEWDEARLQSEVSNFRMDGGVVQVVEANEVRDFLEITSQQTERFCSIQDRYGKSARQIIENPGLALDDKYNQLVQLREKQDDELLGILLSHQRNRIKFFRQFRRIRAEGLSGSLTAGSLAKILALSTEEKQSVREAALGITTTYKDAAIAAQKQAIDRIRQSLPAKKRKRFDKIIEPILSGDGTIWEIDTRMLGHTASIKYRYRSRDSENNSAAADDHSAITSTDKTRKAHQ